jgi:hypothetical protein
MPHEAMSQYLRQVESAIRKSENAYVEHYEEEILTPGRVNLRIRLRFMSGHLLELNEAAVSEEGDIRHPGYRYHFQDKDDKLIFRYDNTPHFPKIGTFPHHKHLKENVLPSVKPSIFMVIREAVSLSQSDSERRTDIKNFQG